MAASKIKAERRRSCRPIRAGRGPARPANDHRRQGREATAVWVEAVAQAYSERLDEPTVSGYLPF
jgi:hypothetical protein